MRNTGLRKACLYALPAYQGGRFGPVDEEKSALFRDFIKGQGNPNRIRDIFSATFFIAMSNFLLLAQEYRLDTFYEKVVEAYWLGSELLEPFFKKGEVVPFHLFHLLAELNIPEKDECRVSWGQVTNIKPSGEVVIVRRPLINRGRVFELNQIEVKEANWDKELVPEMKIGDLVSLHWSEVIEVLTTGQVGKMWNYTKKVLDLINR